jgi:hypothetical protein
VEDVASYTPVVTLIETRRRTPPDKGLSFVYLITFWLLSVLVLVGLLFVSYMVSRGTGPSRIKAEVVSPPRIEVSTPSLDFGQALPLAHIRPLTITNTSSTDTHVRLAFDGFPAGIEVFYAAENPSQCAPGGLCTYREPTGQPQRVRLPAGGTTVLYLGIRTSDPEADFGRSATGRITVIAD